MNAFEIPWQNVDFFMETSLRISKSPQEQIRA